MLFTHHLLSIDINHQPHINSTSYLLLLWGSDVRRCHNIRDTAITTKTSHGTHFELNPQQNGHNR
jgi:hypothetical protein